MQMGIKMKSCVKSFVLLIVMNATKIEGKIVRKNGYFHASFTIVSSSSKLVSQSNCIGKFNDVSIHQCVKKCILYIKCISFNFASHRRLCEIFSISKFEELDLMKREEGWSHYETDVNEKKIGPVCEALSPCRDYEICEDTYEKVGYICRCKDWHKGDLCDKYVGPGTSKEMRAASCKLLRDQFKSIPEGNYWLKGKAVKVFCNGRVDGGWGEWCEWQECDVTCGKGLKRRIRVCNKPSPKLGGKDCIGKNIEVSDCSSNACPLTNIALSKPSNHSISLSSAYPGKNGNDGDKNTYFMTKGGLTNPFWEVDLGKPAVIMEMKVRINKDTRKELKIDTRVEGQHYVLCNKIEAPEKKQYELNCSSDTTAQYIRLVEMGTDYLHLFELEVFGTYL